MKKSIRNLLVTALAVLSLSLVGCGEDKMNNNTDGNSSTVQDQTQSSNPTTKAEYDKYLKERYDYYFGNNTIVAQYDTYNIYNDNFDYTGTYDEFITGYNDFYAKDRDNLKAFKKDLEGFYKKGDAEVDKLHNEVITAIDEAIVASDTYSNEFADKTKDYGTLAKDEVIKGLRDIGRVPYEARVKLYNLVNNNK